MANSSLKDTLAHYFYGLLSQSCSSLSAWCQSDLCVLTIKSGKERNVTYVVFRAIRCSYIVSTLDSDATRT